MHTILAIMTENSVKHALGVSPNAFFGDAIPTEQSLLAEIDRILTATPPQTIRDYVDKLMDRQSRLIVAAQKSQQKVNTDNLQNGILRTRGRPRYGLLTGLRQNRQGHQTCVKYPSTEIDGGS